MVKHSEKCLAHMFHSINLTDYKNMYYDDVTHYRGSKIMHCAWSRNALILMNQGFLEEVGIDLVTESCVGGTERTKKGH